MKLLSEREQVRGVAKRWAQSYGAGTYGADKRGRAVGAELAALDPEKATAEQVCEIIGNKAWCGPIACDECGEVSYQVVELGQEPDYESATASICLKCLEKAVTLARSAG